MSSLYSTSSSYDHEFVCLSNGLDPSAVNPAESSIDPNLGPLNAAEMIRQQSHLLPVVLQPYTDSIATEFKWKGYQARNDDLAGLSPSQLVEHFIAHGIKEPRHWDQDAPLLNRRFAWLYYSGNDSHLSSNIQAIVHCYHYQVLCYQLPYLRQLSRLGAKIVILVANPAIADSAVTDLLKSLNTGHVSHEWIRIENQGEDWSSFHLAYKSGVFDEAGVTYKFQTKLSANLGMDGGAAWIDEALGAVCGSQSLISRALGALIADGAPVAASAAVKRLGYGINEGLIRAFLSRLKFEDDVDFSTSPFAGGSMFVARNEFIKRFYVDLGEIDYSMAYDSGSKYCGRFAGHAIERVFFYYASRFSERPVAWLE